MITEEQIYGQELRQEDLPASVAVDFCPHEKIPCMCWDLGECQAHKSGMRCVMRVWECD